MKKIVILFTHPVYNKSVNNRALIEGIKGIEGIHIHDLYMLYPDYHIPVKKEQELLLEHDIIVWQHPFYWYGSPSLLKEWIDLVLEHNWAYGKNGSMLKDKWIFSTLTTGGGQQAYTEDGYNRFSIPQFLLPFKRTAMLCKMHYLPPFVVHGTHMLSPEELERQAEKYKKVLVSLRDDLFSLEEIRACYYLNDLIN